MKTFVIDGAMISTNSSVNPSLSITVIAELAIQKLKQKRSPKKLGDL